MTIAPERTDFETLLCSRLYDEGLGSLYERVMLSRWFDALAAQRGYRSVLELGCPITKGYDNLLLMERGLEVTLADADIERIERSWKFELRPKFASLDAAPKADLVWNFAVAQLDPSVVRAMAAHARRDVLVFVPNLLNPGAPFHLAYHLLTRTPCHHAERGSRGIRTRTGLIRLLRESGLRVEVSGYVDAPPIPDIAFSIRELKQALGVRAASNGGSTAVDPEQLWRRVQTMSRFDESRLVAPFRGLVGHHIFALGSVE